MTSDWFKNTSVHVLTAPDFENDHAWITKDKKCQLLFFLANWCGHCKNLKPELIKFADVAQFIKVGAIDSDAQKELLEKMQGPGSPIKIKGYPTIWIYKNGKPLREYTGENNAKGLLAEALKVCGTKCECESK